MSKRGDRVAPPGRPGGWEARFATSDGAKGWEQLCQEAPNATWMAWVVLTENPMTRDNLGRQHRLKGKLGSRELRGGRVLEQWQYEVTGGGRIWYCPDPDSRIVWVTDAGVGHPWRTD